ncbi:alkaline phosphatase, tissue-nonspecific isozyme-like [Lineus longissimus]|uniref:alkaline phosphatase, tissue-nonspecific isozyme-like n=1 Tax=Lineus longissimus TaxID=88925 RepID=UPI002B4E16BC
MNSTSCVSRMAFLVLLACQVVVFGRKLEPKAKWLASGQDELIKSLKIAENYGVAKNVIMFLGDGMGVSTVTAMRIYKGQKEGKQGEETQLNFEKFPSVALSKTYNTDRQVADSAGTATAYLCGAKSRYGIIAYDDTVTVGDCASAREDAEVSSILEWSAAKGKSTGVVSTARITHASPAAAYAKSSHRNWEDDAQLPASAKGKCKDIAAQLIERGKDISVILGGGRAQMMPKTTSDPEYTSKKGNRLDGRDLIEEWKKDKSTRGKEAKYVWNIEDFDKVDPKKTDFLMGLFEPSHMQYELDRVNGGNKEPSLAELTSKAIKMLQKNDKGYFLFVEGGRIDHAHHEGIARYAIEDGIAFEAAVQAAIDLTDMRDTLIVVTADHSHTMVLSGYPSRGHPLFDITDYANGTDGMPFTSVLYGNGPGYEITPAGRANLTDKDTEDPHYKQQAAVPLGSETHGGEDVTIYAQGPMSHLFHGVHEQHYIAHVMGYAACVGPNQDHCTRPEVVRIGDGLICMTQSDMMSSKGTASKLIMTIALTALGTLSSFLLLLVVFFYRRGREKLPLYKSSARRYTSLGEEDGDI